MINCFNKERNFKMIEEKSTPNKRSNIKNSRKRRSYGCKKSKNNVEINKNITPINLSILKKKKIEDLQKSIFKMIPNYDGGILKQELVFNILRWQASQRGKIYEKESLSVFKKAMDFLGSLLIITNHQWMIFMLLHL